EFPDKYFELAIVDPPYGIGFAGFEKHYGGGNALAKTKLHKPFAGNDLTAPDKEYFQELFRVSKNQIIFGANHFISKIPFDSSCWIVWDKINGENPFADCELAWTSFKSAVRKFDFKWQGMLQGDMKNKEERIHPTQKPVALYKWLLEHYAKKGDKILDTHLGSMSSVIACYEMGYDITGSELDPEYYRAGIERVNKHTSQLRLDDIINGD
ncbi:MAG TPA: DNA methyltransferase, partial [bacterium]|nr:DNA methyltransferase [bacterium]